MNWVKIKLKALLRILWKIFLYRIVFRTKNREGEYFRNQFGSIISPLEYRIAWDGRLSHRASLLNELTKPATESSKDLRLVRLGSTGDGGYFLPETYRDCDGAISGGISNNNDFEYDLARNRIPVIQFDHSIIEPPIKDELLHFKRERLGIDGFSLSETITVFKEVTGKDIKRGILKWDIEGSEFDFISGATVEDLLNFDIIVIELHFLGNIYQDSFWGKVEDSLYMIRKNHKPIIALGNNSRSFVQIGGIPICDILEITFVRNTAAVPFFDKNESTTAQIESRASLRIS